MVSERSLMMGMMGTLTKSDISINFCGGCNPRIERMQIAEALRAIFTASGKVVGYNSWNAKVMVYLSGCPANCIRHHSSNPTPCVVVAGETVDSMTVDCSQIVPLVAVKVKDLLAISEPRLNGQSEINLSMLLDGSA